MKIAEKGFTLIELMVIVSIIAILAAIAVPSYRQYTVKNAESQTKARMKQLEIELERWRGKALTYKGFLPQKTTGSITSYEFDADGKNIYVPDSSNIRYTIKVLDISSTTASEVTLIGGDTTTNVDVGTGQGWVMFATPNTSLANIGAPKLLLSSDGRQCKNAASTFNLKGTCNEAGSQKW